MVREVMTLNIRKTAEGIYNLSYASLHNVIIKKLMAFKCSLFK